MPVQPPVSFRPLLGIHVTSEVRGLEPALRRFIADGTVLNPIYCFALVSQRRSVDIIQRLAGA
ncbi:hypothetical protein HAX54_036835, partial [Datura stramonium]|nr:hypothetical protein [Datura stramonium]